MRIIFIVLVLLALLSLCSCRLNLAKLLARIVKLDGRRSGLRPYVRSKPATVYRVGRDIQKKPNYCVILEEAVFCTNDDEDVECPITENLKGSTMRKFKQFTIIEVNSNTGEKRFTLYPKKTADSKAQQQHLLTIHPSETADSQQGFTVTDDTCWTQLVNLLSKSSHEMASPVGKLAVL